MIDSLGSCLNLWFRAPTVFADLNRARTMDCAVLQTPYVPKPEETLYQMYPGKMNEVLRTSRGLSLQHRAHWQHKDYVLTEAESKLFTGF
eukprot:1899657-Pyramimonas_sp.AAC.1